MQCRSFFFPALPQFLRSCQSYCPRSTLLFSNFLFWQLLSSAVGLAGSTVALVHLSHQLGGSVGVTSGRFPRRCITYHCGHKFHVFLELSFYSRMPFLTLTLFLSQTGLGLDIRYFCIKSWSGRDIYSRLESIRNIKRKGNILYFKTTRRKVK